MRQARAIMADEPGHEERIALVAEELVVGKRTVETGRVDIRTVVDERTEWARQTLMRENVRVEMVEIGRPIDVVPEIREVDGVTIFPVIEEEMVVTRRLVLARELHIHRERTTEEVAQPVTLRAERAVIEQTSTGLTLTATDPNTPTPEA